MLNYTLDVIEMLEEATREAEKRRSKYVYPRHLFLVMLIAIQRRKRIAAGEIINLFGGPEILLSVLRSRRIWKNLLNEKDKYPKETERILFSDPKNTSSYFSPSVQEILKLAFKIKEREKRKKKTLLTTDYLFRSFMESDMFLGFFQEIEKTTGITVEEVKKRIKKPKKREYLGNLRAKEIAKTSPFPEKIVIHSFVFTGEPSTVEEIKECMERRHCLS